MENEINDIDDLIGKVLAGEASAEEQQRLADWLHIRADNRKYVDQMKAIFEKAASNSIEFDFDADAAWNKVKGRLQETKKDNTRTIVNERWTLRIAAAIVILLGIGIIAYQFNNKPIDTFAVVTDSTTVEKILPDGSIAFLNTQSSIAYEFNPGEKTRKVKLKGEGFFDVKHEEEKPFVIEADKVLVRDIGTAFNIKAYPESDTIMVTVKSGEVQVYTLENSGLSLNIGETAIYSKSLRQFTRLEKVDTNILSYKTRVFSFNSTDLKTVIDKINQVYKSRIKLENPALASCRLTVNFEGEKLDTIIEVIAETLKLSVTREKKEILLNGQGCN